MNITDLVRDHHARVFRVARGIVRDAATAEDVTQDVFLDLLRNPGAADNRSRRRIDTAAAGTAEPDTRSVRDVDTLRHVLLDSGS
jgi:hypothetical protein